MELVAIVDQLSPYSPKFYDAQRAGSLSSAEIVLPIAFDLLSPSSVLDIGCGVGTWLAAAHKLGATRLIGYDGPHVTRDMLVDDEVELRSINLECEGPKPERSDLAMSLECAEHVSQAAGCRIIECLCQSADAVLFGAAIPGQGGKHHVNEQWQSYWIRLFADNGFDAYDVIRPVCWNDRRIEVWYAQNTLLYLKRGGRLGLSDGDRVVIPDIVHPRLWENPPPKTVLRHLPRVFNRIAKF
jgi:SAM-dependent methyltransferase